MFLPLWTTVVLVVMTASKESSGQITCDDGDLVGFTVTKDQTCTLVLPDNGIVQLDALTVNGQLIIGSPLSDGSNVPSVPILKVETDFTISVTGIVTADGNGFTNGGPGVGNADGSGGNGYSFRVY